MAGPPPSSVTGQVGRAADLVAWYAEAYNDIQRDRDGKWKWLRRDFTLNTVVDDPWYLYSDCTDVLAAAAISRFRAWDLDERQLPFIYLVSDGESTETELQIAEWSEFRRRYIRGTHTSAYPCYVSVDPANDLYLGPTPNDIYRVSGTYWRGNQSLEVDADTPEMPADYHMLIVYRALLKYAYNVAAPEVLTRATVEGSMLEDALAMNQAYSRFSLSTAGALA